MKNQITILLITAHLFAYTDFSQLLKFPQLLKHYQIHLSLNKSLSFFDFLELHYGRCNKKGSNPDREDMKLPFKTIDLHIVAHTDTIPAFCMSKVFVVLPYHNHVICYHHMIVTTTPSAGIFRPPIINV